MKIKDYQYLKYRFIVFTMMLLLVACDKDKNPEIPDQNNDPTDTQIEIAWVYFKDKPSKNTFLANPSLMLSPRSLLRRTKQNISLDEIDVPIEKIYYNQIKNTIGIKIMAKSKWLNALHIEGTKTNINKLKQLLIVAKVEFADKSLNLNGRIATSSKRSHHPENKFGSISTDLNYGNGFTQINMLGGDVLHQQNFTGNGIIIAVIDGGFPGVDTFNAFKRLRDNNKILGGYNYVTRNNNFYTGVSHGTSVLSTIAAYIDNQFIGTAPDASFYLFITEDGPTESPLEESLWVEAAEKADSLGVDIINTSLGYSTFDNPKYDYTYADMNGNKTFISRGAEIGFSRGMILVNAVGNEGANSWKYITAPADAKSVLSVGAVDASKVIASFSSFGPTSDGRIKPEVLAQGSQSFVINSVGQISPSSGTSFASPIMAGVIACYWQKNSTKKNSEIIRMIKESANLYTNPTLQSQYGYGIPKFN
ncbi:MAG: S8 family serine peptidase [Flavobacteriaceae bacterium]|nr:S8 family serine peptidase [Flavobacteriaceae bacterium]